MEEQNRKKPDKRREKKAFLREDAGKRTAPGSLGDVTGGATRATRPEQGPEVPPQERTEGIP